MATGGNDSTATSDGIIHIKCCFCAEENRKREAEKYCVDCKDYYCSPCIGIHKRFPSTKRHQVLDKDGFKSLGPDDSLPSYPTQRCSEHENEVLTMFCEDHDEVACPQCIACIHMTCNKILTISEEITRLHQNIKPGDVKMKLQQRSAILDKIKKERGDKLKEMNKTLAKEIAFVKEFNQKLKGLLDASEKETMQELRKKYDTIRTAVNDDIKTIEYLVKSLRESIELFQKNEGNISQEFVSVKCSEKLVVRATELENTLKRKPIASCKFIRNQDMMESIANFKNLGKVSSCSESQEVIASVKDELYTIKKMKEINVKLKADKNTCDIWGSCITEDEFLLLTDSNNNKLKRVDLNRETVSDYIDLQNKPYAVCTLNRTEAAVTLDNNSVLFISLGDKMAATRTLYMNHTCFGIACRDDKLYITDNEDRTYLHDTTGRVMQTTCVDTNNRDIFTQNQHIALSSDGNKVYVTDWFNGLVVLDSQGNYLTTLTDSRIKDYRGVCTVGRNVFVSGWNSKDIVQISPDLKTLGVVGNGTSVLSLCSDQRGSLLIVTKFSSDMITILELS